MKKTKTQKGITLVALIVTVVALLILAAVTIKAIQGNGIIRYAQNSKKQYEFATIIEDINLRISKKIIEGNKIEDLNGFESIDYVLPKKYEEKLLLIKGEIYCSYLADSDIKEIGYKNGIYTYYVNDESLKCLYTSTSRVIKKDEDYMLEDESGNNNCYIIHNYNDECVKEKGIQLSDKEGIFLKDNPLAFAKTAIITISNSYKDGISRILFRGDANNFYSMVCLKENSVGLWFRTTHQEETYKTFSVNASRNYGDTIQIASTISDSGNQAIYINGEKIGEFDGRKDDSCIFTQYIGGRYNYYDSKYEINGNYMVCSIQLYNRELTEEEILNNYNFDKKLYDI